ncbi:MAG: hypothetical protein ABR564_03760 [Candidatus Dormibacteria bacterium]
MSQGSVDGGGITGGSGTDVTDGGGSDVTNSSGGRMRAPTAARRSP